MKSLLLATLSLLGFLTAQEFPTRATLTAPIIREPLPEPAPRPVLRLDLPKDNIIGSKTVIADGQKITLQEIQPITLPPIPPPPPQRPLSAEQLAERRALLARAPKNHALMISCTIYDDTHTLIRGMTRTDNISHQWEAWSNINFHHFTALPTFQKNGESYSLIFAFNDENTVRTAARFVRRGKIYTPPAIPSLPGDPIVDPQFIVITGKPNAADLLPIIALHELYQDHHKDLISEYRRIKIEREREAAERLANPPDPKPDLIIQHWTITPDAPPAPTKIEYTTTKKDAQIQETNEQKGGQIK